MVPANVHGQALAAIDGNKTGEPIPKYDGVVIIVQACMGFIQGMEDQRSTETVGILTLWKWLGRNCVSR